jgi:hypothetical protein
MLKNLIYHPQSIEIKKDYTSLAARCFKGPYEGNELTGIFSTFKVVAYFPVFTKIQSIIMYLFIFRICDIWISNSKIIISILLDLPFALIIRLNKINN